MHSAKIIFFFFFANTLEADLHFIVPNNFLKWLDSGLKNVQTES